MAKIDGRKAVVINDGKTFTDYRDFALKHGYPDAASGYYRKDERGGLDNGDEVTLLVNGPHLTGYRGKTLWIVETAVGDRYIIGEDGLEIVEEAEDLANITVLPDEALGGLLREYAEVKRKAAVGERIKATGKSGDEEYEIGDILAVIDDNPAYDFVTYDDDLAGLRDLTEYVVLEASDIVHIDGKDGGTPARYRLVERKANVGERVISLIGDGALGLSSGNRYIVKYAISKCVTVTDDQNDDHEITNGSYRVLESVEITKPSANIPQEIVEGLTGTVSGLLSTVSNLSARLLTVERQLAAAEREIAELKAPKPRTSGGTCADYPKVKSLTRDDVIERAKRDVADLKRKMAADKPNEHGNRTFQHGVNTVKFHVNKDKRAVTALVHGKYDGDLREKGIAKCAPGDVFNVHIGRAISLRRALGLEVPAEYTNVAAPDSVRVGDLVKYGENVRKVWYRMGSANGRRPDASYTYQCTAECSYEAGNCRIIDDSREEVSE